jgi:voltage-gated potassium channel
MVIGVVGYRILGLSWFEAFYQTAITVTTVGFHEHGPVDKVDDGYRAFTLVLVFGGVSSALYTLGVTVEALVEGALNDELRVRREQRMIDDMNDHIVIAGAGRVGRSIAQYASRHGADLVVIDRGEGLALGHPVIEGDATDDEILLRAGVLRARTLIAALDSDADNLYVTLSARALNPSLYIVARTNIQAAEPKFFQAGADRVVNPHQIGGSRMGAVAMHPAVAEFLDEVLHDDSHDVEIGEVSVAGGGDHRVLGDILASLADPPIALAVRSHDHGYAPLPRADQVLEAGDVIVVLGSRQQLAALYAVTH